MYLRNVVTHSVCCWGGSWADPALSAWQRGRAAARGCSCSAGPAVRNRVRIRDILIRIWILGSLHLITDPDPALIILNVIAQQGLQLGTDLSNQYAGSVTYWYGSRSLDPYAELWIRILLLSLVAFKMPTKIIFCLLLFEGTYTLFLKDKSHKKSQNVEIKVFLIFAWVWKVLSPYK